VKALTLCVSFSKVVLSDGKEEEQEEEEEEAE
jgi:hypothetical protein